MRTRDITFVMGNDDNDDNDAERGWTVTGSDVVMRMDPADRVEHAFSGWFTDSSYDTPFTASTISFS